LQLGLSVEVANRILEHLRTFHSLTPYAIRRIAPEHVPSRWRKSRTPAPKVDGRAPRFESGACPPLQPIATKIAGGQPGTRIHAGFAETRPATTGRVRWAGLLPKRRKRPSCRYGDFVNLFPHSFILHPRIFSAHNSSRKCASRILPGPVFATGHQRIDTGAEV